MKRLLIIVAFLMISVAVKAQTPITIENASFETLVNFNGNATGDPWNPSCGPGHWGLIPGWTTTGPPTGAAGVVAWTCETIPDGKQVAFIGYGSSISQNLGIAPQVGIYTLKLFLANWFYYYPNAYTVSLTIGGTPVCSVTGYPLGDFTEVPLVCTLGKYIAIFQNYGYVGNLGISVAGPASPGWPVLIDKVSLTFIPKS